MDTQAATSCGHSIKSSTIKCRSFQRNVCRCNFFIVPFILGQTRVNGVDSPLRRWTDIRTTKNSIRIDHGPALLQSLHTGCTIGAFSTCFCIKSNVRMSADFIFQINKKKKKWRGNSVDCFVFSGRLCQRLGSTLRAQTSSVCPFSVGRNAPLHQIGLFVAFPLIGCGVSGDCPWVCLLAEVHIRFELDARFGCENRVDLLRNNIMGFYVLASIQ